MPDDGGNVIPLDPTRDDIDGFGAPFQAAGHIGLRVIAFRAAELVRSGEATVDEALLYAGVNAHAEGFSDAEDIEFDDDGGIDG